MPGEAPVTAAETPATLRWAIRLLAVETVVIVGLAGFLVYEAITADADTQNGAVAVTLWTAVIAGLFGLVTWSLWRRRGWARGPAVVLNLLLLPIGYSLLSGLPWLGLPVMAVGVAVAAMLVAPSTRAAL